MKQMAYDSMEELLAMESEGDKRRKPRLEGQLSLTFSGMDATEMFFESGSVIDLCQDGIGARTERSLKPGMELTLFIEHSDSEDHFCIPGARVAWASGNSFGLSIQSLKTEDQEELHRLFLSAGQQPQEHDN
jgi:PilZ domain